MMKMMMKIERKNDENHKKCSKNHSSWQCLLGPKKSPRKSTYIGPKVHIVATWGTLKKLNFSTPLGDSS